ncbi:lipid-A-disaccharide synthase [Betaproteobacteria bacterium]|nr:lipid-A-disaccharide synthase [Betaproteobacteria bacterium]GHU44993.1 lipid-A-disaccharide synthase [Betaproteobacteria bacterium]
MSEPVPVVRIAIVAGEASGDLLASHLMAALKEKLPQVSFCGIGGPKMLAQGFDAWWPLEKLAVMGYVEVLKRYREISGIRRALKARLLADKPDLFIGVDAPDFNLGLETDLRQKGIKTVHYVSPSIWAWRGSRIKKVAKAADRVLALFPMEPPLYRRAGVPVTYVGHPLADQIPRQTDKKQVRDKLELPNDRPIYALLPGSRQSEVKALSDTFIATARLIDAQTPNALFLVPFVTRETRLEFEAALYRQDATKLPFRLLFGHAQDAMGAADAVLVASGTATLEVALVKRPMVITYKLSPLTYRLMKRRAYLPYVGLPNVLAGRFIVPELLQNDATPEKLAEALIKEATPERATELNIEFTRIHDALRQNTAEKAAGAVVDLLKG